MKCWPKALLQSSFHMVDFFFRLPVHSPRISKLNCYVTLAEGIKNKTDKTLFLFGKHHILNCLALLVHLFLCIHFLWISFSGWTLTSHGTVMSIIDCFLSHDHSRLCGFRVVVVTSAGTEEINLFIFLVLLLHNMAIFHRDSYFLFCYLQL